MRKRILSMMIVVMMLINMLPIEISASEDVTIYSVDAVEYLSPIINEDNTVSFETKTVDAPTLITSATTNISNGWYVVTGNVNITNSITYAGDVHLILADNSSLEVAGLNGQNSDATITIYAQSTNETTMGKLTATSTTIYAAGIGGYQYTNGTVTINGGVVTATSSGGTDAGAGIGGGYWGSGTVTINGGIVMATSTGWGAGIGGGIYSNGTVTINGGTVMATSSGGNAGASIGGGYSSDGSSIVTIATAMKYGTSTSSLDNIITFTQGTGVGMTSFTNQYAKVQTMDWNFTTQPTGGTYTYGNTIDSLSVGITDGIIGVSYQWYSCNSGGGSATSITDASNATYQPSVSDAGTYYYYCTVRQISDGITVTANSSITTVTINIAIPTVTPPTANTGLTYDGTAQALITAGSTTGGTLEYSLDGTNYSESIPTATNAGTYIVYYKVVGDNNYDNVEASSINVTIAQIQLTWNSGAVDDKVYDGDNIALVTTAPTLSGVISGDTAPTITVGTVTFASKNVGGDQAVTATGYSVASDTNYLAPTEQPTFAVASITAKELTVTPESGLWKYYGEADSDLTYEYTGNATGEIPKFTGFLTRESGDDVGTYDIGEGTLAFADNGTFLASNYSLVFDIDTVTYEIKAYIIDDKVEDSTDWLSASVVTLIAPSGYTISQSNALTDNTWASEITVDTTEGKEVEVIYYLKSNASNAIATEMIFTYSNDETVPEGEITIDENSFKTFVKSITFGLFFKNNVDVTITAEDIFEGEVLSATDIASGVSTIEYQKVATEADYSVEGTWIKDDKFSVTASETFIVYVKITDNAGNVAIINSEGVVVYTDSAADTTSFDFTKSGEDIDKTIKVELNGNTINTITLNGTVVSAEYYSVDDNKITFKSDYLVTLTRGENVFTISYNPMNETYVEDENNEAPSTTTVTANIYEVIRDTTDDEQSTLYDSNEQSPTAPTATTVGEDLTVKYQDENGQYTLTEIPSFTDAGTYTVYYELSADNHVTITGEIEFTIEQIQLTWNSGTVDDKVYDEATVDTNDTLQTSIWLVIMAISMSGAFIVMKKRS